MINCQPKFVILIIATVFGKLIPFGAAFDLKSSYIGCYQNISATKTGKVDSVEECATLCKDETNNMLALKGGKECNCIESLHSAILSDRCNTSCPNSNACGGKEFYSVYKGKPRLKHDLRYGMNDIVGDLKSITFPKFTLELCAFYCLEKNTSMSCLFKSKPDKCFCLYSSGFTDPLGRNVICDGMCEHDKNEVCKCRFEDGDVEILVYSLYFQYEFQRGKSILPHCPDQKSYGDLVTKCTESCDKGWKGEACNERDCTVENGGCWNGMKCIESTVNGNNYSDCVCPYGTVKGKKHSCVVFKTNLALFQPSYSSSVFSDAKRGKWLASYLNDGLYDGSLSARVNDNKAAWLAVDLGKLVCVGFVEAYNFLFKDETELLYASYFFIRLNKTFDVKADYDIRKKVDLCGSWSSESLFTEEPMRIDCENFTLLSRFVIAQPMDKNIASITFGLAELEVYEAGCDIRNGRCGEQKCTEVFNNGVKMIECIDLGPSLTIDEAPIFDCFRRVEYDYLHNKSGLSYEECRNICKSKSYKLTVVKAGLECACGNKLIVNDKAPIEECLIKQYDTFLVYDDCTEENNFCGRTLSKSRNMFTDEGRANVPAISNNTIPDDPTEAVVSLVDDAQSNVSNIIIGILLASLVLLLAVTTVAVKLKDQKEEGGGGSRANQDESAGPKESQWVPAEQFHF